MRCDQARGLLDPYHDGELDPAARTALEEHTTACAACREGLEARLRLAAGLAALPLPAAPAAGPAGILAALPVPPPGPRTRFWLRARPMVRVMAAAGAGVAIFGAYFAGFEPMMDWLTPKVESSLDDGRLADIHGLNRLVEEASEEARWRRHTKARAKLLEARRLARHARVPDGGAGRVRYCEEELERHLPLDTPADRDRAARAAARARAELTGLVPVPGERIEEGRWLAVQAVKALAEAEGEHATALENLGDRAGARTILEGVLPWVARLEVSVWTGLAEVDRYGTWDGVAGTSYRSRAWDELLDLLDSLGGLDRDLELRRALLARLAATAADDPLAGFRASVEAARLLSKGRNGAEARARPGARRLRLADARAAVDLLVAQRGSPGLARLERQTRRGGLARHLELTIRKQQVELAGELADPEDPEGEGWAEGLALYRAVIEGLPEVAPDWDAVLRTGWGWSSLRWSDLGQLYRDVFWNLESRRGPGQGRAGPLELVELAFETAERHLQDGSPGGALAFGELVTAGSWGAWNGGDRSAAAHRRALARLDRSQAALERVLAGPDRPALRDPDRTSRLHETCRDLLEALARQRDSLAEHMRFDEGTGRSI